MSGFNLDDYVTVAERIEQFYSQFPEGSLQAEIYELSEKQVVVRAYAYRNADDPRPAIAHSSLTIPGATPYTKGSEIENAETSAVGRAIALLGFGVKKSVGSRDELRAKGAESQSDGHGSLIGVARVGTKQTSDGQLRQTPDGYVMGFRLESREGDRGGVLVEAKDALAEALALVRDQWFNQPVTVWGKLETKTFRPKGVKRDVSYQVLALERMQAPEFILPSDAGPVAAPAASASPERPGETPAPTDTATQEASAGRSEPEAGAVFDERIAAPAPNDPELDALPMFEEDVA